MNPKFFLLTLLLVSLRFAIPSLVVNVNGAEKSIITTTEAPVLPAALHAEHHDFLLFIESARDIYENMVHAADDAKFYLFSFERVRRSRWAAKVWLALVRMAVILSHVSVLIYAFKGLLGS
ncbi:MAG TPA: hypothetical protein VNR87_09000 [Flavisolibacter sp.]|nr:hypothetical protein [Flavisolibacter sp.]